MMPKLKLGPTPEAETPVSRATVLPAVRLLERLQHVVRENQVEPLVAGDRDVVADAVGVEDGQRQLGTQRQARLREESLAAAVAVAVERGLVMVRVLKAAAGSEVPCERPSTTIAKP